MLIDTHCHLNFDWFDADREAVVARAQAAGVQQIVVPAVDLPSCTAVLTLAEKYECVYAAIGIHPNSSAPWQDSWVEELHAFAQHEKVVAIGEIGLDYYRDKSPAAVQKQALQAQLDLAASLDLPVILHNRESDADIIAILSAAKISERAQPGVLHSFFSSWDVAAEALALGYYLGFTGPVTFKKAERLRQVVAQVPLERLLVETDAPFLTPQQHRGKRNEPAYVTYVADRIAAVRGLETAVFAIQTTANAHRLFARMPAL